MIKEKNVSIKYFGNRSDRGSGKVQVTTVGGRD